MVKEHATLPENEAGGKYLVGYYVSETSLDDEKMISCLKDKLPDYMIPSALVHLKQLPLTINGKLDRKVLPDPNFTRTKTYTTPRNDLEEQVVGIWAEVLRQPKDTIGIQDDFFRLGGNSILAIRLTNRINKQFNKNFHVAIIFKNTTILKLVSSLENETEESAIKKNNCHSTKR